MDQAQAFSCVRSMFCQEREANKSDVLKSGRMVMMSRLQRKEERWWWVSFRLPR